MSVHVETPPHLRGTPEQQLQQTYSYLFRLSEYLNVALGSLRELQAADSGRQPAVSGEAEQRAETYNELRALVVNTADITRTELDRLETVLGAQYESISGQWGSFLETVEAKITATAGDVVQQLAYDARLDTLDSQAAGFEAYRVRSESYIRSGFLDYDELGVPVVGIAIGQNLSAVTVTVDGRDYQQLDKSQSCAFYTADKVSFRINGVEVAYVSNRKLYIHDVEITGSAVLGGKWHLSTANGFMIKWIGG